MDAARTALVVIDVQEGVIPPADLGLSRSTPAFERNMTALLHAFREHNLPVFHVQHHSRHKASRLHPSKPTVAILPFAAPSKNEPIITKSTNSAFVNTNLAELIQSHGVQRVVFCGTTTQHCVSTTVRAASDLQVVEHAYGVSGVDNPMPGRIVVVSDATAMYDAFLGGKMFDAQLAHELALAHLQDEFASVESTSEVIAKLQKPNNT